MFAFGFDLCFAVFPYLAALHHALPKGCVAEHPDHTLVARRKSPNVLIGGTRCEL